MDFFFLADSCLSISFEDITKTNIIEKKEEDESKSQSLESIRRTTRTTNTLTLWSIQQCMQDFPLSSVPAFCQDTAWSPSLQAHHTATMITPISKLQQFLNHYPCVLTHCSDSADMIVSTRPPPPQRYWYFLRKRTTAEIWIWVRAFFKEAGHDKITQQITDFIFQEFKSLPDRKIPSWQSELFQALI